MTKNNQVKVANFQPRQVPTQSGVYLFLNSQKEVIYVGKAINLRRRLASYFQSPQSPKVSQITNRAQKINFITTPSDFEALILEAKLIKQYLPKYNTSLKDDKHYLYIKINQEDFPQIATARKITKKAYLFGPFPSTKTVRLILKQIRKIFPYRSCLRLPNRPCLYYHLNLCPAPCLNQSRADQKKYYQQVQAIKKILGGQSQKLIREYQKEMIRASQKQDYETAQEAKKIYDGLNFLTQKRMSPDLLLADLDLGDSYRWRALALEKILRSDFTKIAPLRRIEAYDIANISGQDATGSLIVFSWGRADNRQYRQFKISQPGQPNDPKMMAEILSRRLKHPEWPYPNLIIVDGGKPQLSAALKVLKDSGLTIPVLGLAKKEEEIIIKVNKGFKTLRLDRQSPALLLLEAARDEAHRFAQRYHHQLRSRKIANV